LNFLLPKKGFKILNLNPKPHIKGGLEYKAADPGWVKLKGMG